MLQEADLVLTHGEGLSLEQRRILRLVSQGRSVFFTGAAGTGKSLTLRSIIKMLKQKYSPHTKALAVTASTGIAALNIGGETLHSFAGVGLGKKPAGELLLRLSRKSRERWISIKTLIIDEISMVDGTFFDKLEIIARDVRENQSPFGGVQLVICGDFFQLPPVPDQYQGAPVPVCFAFDAHSWRQCIGLQIRLTQVFRQTDPEFVDILNKMRLGHVNANLEHELHDLRREIVHNGIEPIHIYPRNYQVENENTSRLEALPGKLFSNTAADCGRWLEHEQFNGHGHWIPVEERDELDHQKRITNLLDKYANAPGSIQLKEGAQVMLIKNIVPGQLVNGSLGRVVTFLTAQEARSEGIQSVVEILEGVLEVKSTKQSLGELERIQSLPGETPDIPWPMIEFLSGRKVLFTPLPFDMEDAFGDLEATRLQVPLILAWAITVHKSQGQTIERLKIDFDGTFEYGQAYVAISRSTGMNALQLVNFKPMMVRAHPRVLKWYEGLLKEEEMDGEFAISAYFLNCR